jgi:hypothetical protein
LTTARRPSRSIRKRRPATERAKPKGAAPTLSPTEVQQLKALIPLVPFVPTLVKLCREYEAAQELPRCDCPAMPGVPHVHDKGGAVAIKPTPPAIEQPLSLHLDGDESELAATDRRKNVRTDKNKRVHRERLVAFIKAVDAVLRDSVPPVSSSYDPRTWPLELESDYRTYENKYARNAKHAKATLRAFKQYGIGCIRNEGIRLPPLPSFKDFIDDRPWQKRTAREKSKKLTL